VSGGPLRKSIRNPFFPGDAATRWSPGRGAWMPFVNVVSAAPMISFPPGEGGQTRFFWGAAPRKVGGGFRLPRAKHRPLGAFPQQIGDFRSSHTSLGKNFIREIRPGGRIRRSATNGVVDFARMFRFGRLGSAKAQSGQGGARRRFIRRRCRFYSREFTGTKKKK